MPTSGLPDCALLSKLRRISIKKNSEIRFSLFFYTFKYIYYTAIRFALTESQKLAFLGLSAKW